MTPPSALLVALCFSFASTGARMQEPPVLVSPDVRPDRTVVFRYWAPRAAVVQLSGDFMSGPPVTMTKDGRGVWSVSQGPLEPNIYTYGFTVDGIRADDPWCRCTYAFGGGRGAPNRFTVGAQPPAPWED